MSGQSEQAPVAKKRLGKIWYILGVCAVLAIVYQTGRSSGVRSMSESIERLAVQPQERPTVSALPEQKLADRPANSTASAGRTTHRRIPEVAVQPSDSTPPVAIARPGNVPEHLTTPASLPRRSVESGPPSGLVPSVIASADPSQVPHSVPAHSVYDRRSTAARPSDVGLMPLQPLAPLPAAGVIPATYRQTAPPQGVPATTFKPATVKPACDCGKIH